MSIRATPWIPRQHAAHLSGNNLSSSGSSTIVLRGSAECASGLGLAVRHPLRVWRTGELTSSLVFPGEPGELASSTLPFGWSAPSCLRQFTAQWQVTRKLRGPQMKVTSLFAPFTSGLRPQTDCDLQRRSEAYYCSFPLQLEPFLVSRLFLGSFARRSFQHPVQLQAIQTCSL